MFETAEHEQAKDDPPSETGDGQHLIDDALSWLPNRKAARATPMRPVPKARS